MSILADQCSGCSTSSIVVRLRRVHADAGDALLARPARAVRARRPHPPATTTAKERLQCRPKSRKTPSPATDTTGHEWDGLNELNTPLPKWWLYTFCRHASSGPSVWCVLYPSVPRHHRLFSRRARLFAARSAVDAGVQALAAQRAAYMDKIAATPIAEVRAGSATAGNGADGRPHRVRQQLPALPWRRRRRQARLSGARRRCLAVGRQAGGHPADHHAWRAQRRSRRAAAARCRGSAPTACSSRDEIQAVADYVMTLSAARPPGAGRSDGQAAVRRQLRRLSRRQRPGQSRGRRAAAEVRTCISTATPARRRGADQQSAHGRDAELERAARHGDHQEPGALCAFAGRRRVNGAGGMAT